MGSLSVKKVPSGPRSKVKNEVVAVFSSIEVRDVVRGSAKELAGQSDAGIRLEIPNDLQASLKALEAVSFNLKKKYPNMRHNIKFDDSERDLVLDFCTDPNANKPWKKVRPAQAKALRKKLAKGNGGTGDVSDEELGRMLSV